MTPRRKQLLTAATALLFIAALAAIFWIARGGSSDTESVDLGKTKTGSSQTSNGSTTAKNVRFGSLSLKRVQTFSYTGSSSKGLDQIVISVGGSRANAVGVITYATTSADSLSGLISLNTGGYDAGDSLPPEVLAQEIAGEKGSIVITEQNDGSLRITGVAYIGGKGLQLTFSGDKGKRSEMISTLRSHASALTVTPGATANKEPDLPPVPKPDSNPYDGK